MENQTIAAISTAISNSGISVIRVSGEKAIEICNRIFVPFGKRKLSNLSGYSCAYGYIVSNEEKIDECVATVFVAPFSYTGENVVELSTHGGAVVTKQVLRAVIESGATPAQAGEFTKRAFLNGKLDLTQAEAVMDIISAKSKNALKAANKAKEGALSKKITEINEILVLQAGHLSAWADYPEEDIPEVDSSELLKNLGRVKDELSKLVSNYDSGQVIKSGVDTVIIGKPNVGKSTLMNLLSGYEKSIVTDIEGTTRDVVEETVTLGNIMLNLSDTAGIRETESVVEKIGVDKAKKKLKNAMLVLAVFDMSKELSNEDTEILNDIGDTPFVAIINKCDLDKKLDTDKIKEHTENIVYMSAKESEGLENLKETVQTLFDTNEFDFSSATLYNERQLALAKSALSSTDEAINAVKLGVTLDAVTVLIEDAISSLLELTGERVTDKVVDNVFHTFCVGK